VSDRIRVVYRLAVPSAEAASLAEAIAYEQTVELPAAQVPDDLAARVVARVEGLAADGAAQLATLSYDADLAAGQLGQLLNLLYGNASFYPGVRVVEVAWPDSVLAAFAGPRLGIDGVRRLTGVSGRPLLATALKPVGSSVEDLAAMAGAFARGGGDLLKDDQNLVGATFDGFATRVDACADAVDAANQAGGHCVYWPHVSASAGDFERRLDHVVARGLTGVLCCPLVHGFDRVRALLAERDLGFLAHPALAGAFTTPPDHGIAPEVLLGTLFRLAGADISVFPNHGGRFAFSRGDCGRLRDALRAPLGRLAPALPAPAGGMRFDSLPAMAADYGSDAVFLVGGALQGHAGSLEEGTHAFAARIRDLAGH